MAQAATAYSLQEGSPQHAKVAFASLIGTSIEWYDFFLYNTAAALVFNRLFFPQFDPLVGTLLAFTTYSIGFVARPFGGVIFGHFGDRVGRKKMLYITLLFMGLSSTMVGLLPTYDADRGVGSNPADLDARVPRHRPRWRMGRGGTDGGRTCSSEAPGLVWFFSTDRPGGRRHVVGFCLLVGHHASPSSVSLLGLARAVPVQHRPGSRSAYGCG